jgi:hypothetical protein
MPDQYCGIGLRARSRGFYISGFYIGLRAVAPGLAERGGGLRSGVPCAAVAGRAPLRRGPFEQRLSLPHQDVLLGPVAALAEEPASRVRLGERDAVPVIGQAEEGECPVRNRQLAVIAEVRADRCELRVVQPASCAHAPQRGPRLEKVGDA